MESDLAGPKIRTKSSKNHANTKPRALMAFFVYVRFWILYFAEPSKVYYTLRVAESP